MSSQPKPLASPLLPERASAPVWQRAVLFGTAFFLLAEAGKFLSVRDSTFISFWLPAGLYVAVLLLNERRSWPWLVLAAFTANLVFDLSEGTNAAVALLFCLANAVQSVSGAWLVRRFVAERPTLATVKEFIGFMAFAGALSPILGAAIGAATLAAFGLSGSFAQSWNVWWGSNAMAILLISPFVLTWYSAVRADFPRFARPKRLLEAALLTALMLGLTWHLLFVNQGIMTPHKGWVALTMLWAGMRFGPLGAAAATLVVSVLIAFFTTQFFAGLTPDQIASGEYVFVMQTSLAIAALLSWIPAVVMGERNRKMRELSESETRLRLAVRASNVGLWIWDIVRDELYISPEWKSQLGYRDDEIRPRFAEWRDRLHSEDREKVLPKVRAYLADPGGDYQAEFRLRHKDGSYRWIYARAQVECDAEGRPQRMLGCHIDITDRKRAEVDLQHSLIRLQELSRRLLEVEQTERRNISRELHDRVGQNLAAISLALEMIRGQLPDGSPSPVESQLDVAQSLLKTTSQHVRDVMAELRPAALDDYGLIAAFRTYAADYAKRFGVAVTVNGKDPVPRLPLATETELFRIAQEALHNTAKHARAGKVDILLAEANGRVTLAISDDGVGFDVTKRPRAAQSWGMTTMRERADAVGALLRVESAPGRGTRVEVEVAKAAG